MAWPDSIFAMPSEIIPTEALPVIKTIDWSHPGIAIGIGGTILATQIAELVQRHAMLKHLRPVKIRETQLDLFPETLPTADLKTSPWEVDVATRQGKVRSENQDAVSTLDFADGSKVMIVCDGAGGIEGGREASQSAVAAIVQSLGQQFKENDVLEPQDLEHAIDAARQASASEALTGVTTALLILLQDDQVQLGNAWGWRCCCHLARRHGWSSTGATS